MLDFNVPHTSMYLGYFYVLAYSQDVKYLGHFNIKFWLWPEEFWLVSYKLNLSRLGIRAKPF